MELWLCVFSLIVIACLTLLYTFLKNRSSAEQSTDRAEGGAGNEDELDLHGYYLEDAVKKVREFLRQREDYHKKKKVSVIIITGKGAHSADGRSVLKPKVTTYLEENGYKGMFHEVKGNPGRIKVNLKLEREPSPPESSNQASGSSGTRSARSEEREDQDGWHEVVRRNQN